LSVPGAIIARRSSRSLFWFTVASGMLLAVHLLLVLTMLRANPETGSAAY
jgi:hypothetical protein